LKQYDMQSKSHFRPGPGIRKNDHGRRATTLVELLVVVTLVTILLSIVGSLAVHLRQWDRQVRAHSQHGNQLANLAETLRADFRQATSVTLPAKNTVAIAGPESREIRYELQSEGCRRTVKIPGETSPKIETFAIGSTDSWKLETAAPGRHPACTLSLELSDFGKATSESAPFFVYAALGSDTPQ
jgi:type II secretory pathway pseudopilin PulG